MPHFTSQVLLICHEASRTGVPLLSLEFARWIKSHTDWSVASVLGDNGDLVSVFEELSVRTWPACLGERAWINRATSRLGQLFLNRTPFERFLSQTTPQIVYANSIATLPLLRTVLQLKPGVPYAIHVHELDFVLRNFARGNADLVANANCLIAASEAAACSVAKVFDLPHDRIHVVHEYLCRNAPQPKSNADQSLKELLRQNRPFVLGAGLMSWRKNPEAFIHLAARVLALQGAENMPLFVWAGKPTPQRPIDQLTHDLERMGLTAHVHFVGEVQSLSELLKKTVVFALPSREDTFPLVVLEAAEHSVPTVCFDGGGGAPEFVRDDAGVSVPYGCFDAMSAAIVELIQNPARRAALGATAQLRTAEHTADTVCKRIFQHLQKVANRR